MYIHDRQTIDTNNDRCRSIKKKKKPQTVSAYYLHISFVNRRLVVIIVSYCKSTLRIIMIWCQRMLPSVRSPRPRLIYNINLINKIIKFTYSIIAYTDCKRVYFSNKKKKKLRTTNILCSSDQITGDRCIKFFLFQR